MANDTHLHNQLISLLDTSEYGTRFYLELITLLGEYLQDFVPEGHQRYISTLGLCYLIQKLNGLRFSIPLQKRILKEFIRVAGTVGQ